MRAFACFLFTVLLFSCSEQKEHFTIEVLNGYTPVKNQGKKQTCWAYAMLAAIETEHIMQGDSVHLSVAWVEQAMKQDTLLPPTQRGMGMTLITLMQRYGIVPYDAMKDSTDLPPKYAFMLGATYTPQEFAHSVCRPDEYLGLSSSSQYPYHELFTPELKDNWARHQLLNLPPDSLLTVTAEAVRQHHGVCWEGDISEKGFDWKHGVARLSLVNGSTTDDHCMAIVGLAYDDGGEPFFIMKNSWGTQNPYDGLLFMSYDYFKEKTIAVFLPNITYRKPVKSGNHIADTVQPYQ